MPTPGRPPEAPPLIARGEPFAPQWLQWLDTIRTTLAPPNTAPSRAFYVPTTTGAPTFVPEARGGFAPLAFDPATGTLYIHDGSAWLSTVLT